MKSATNFDVECYYKAQDIEVPLLEVLNFKNNQAYTNTTKMNLILFVMEGSLNLSSDVYPDVCLNEKEAIFLPGETRCIATSETDGRVLVIHLDPFQNLDGSYSVQELFAEFRLHQFSKEAGVIVCKDIVCRYLEDMASFLEHGVFNKMFYELKIKELLFILYQFYEKKQLCNFFKTILNSDFAFASFVVKNWKNVKNVKELAELSTYCETGFNKKFKKVFGITPYKWLNEKKADKILYDIINSRKTFKLIAEEYNFNSSQQFHDYCIRNFKKPPGSIRKKTREKSKNQY